MTYEEFLSEVKTVLANEEQNGGYYSVDGMNGRDSISVYWISGGITGGNCWGGEADSPLSSDLPKELVALDVIIGHFRPSLSFMEYKMLSNKLIKHKIGGDGYSDYYGNYTEYTYRYVYLDELYEYLKENLWLP